jgi:hypothetical protein
MEFNTKVQLTSKAIPTFKIILGSLQQVYEYKLYVRFLISDTQVSDWAEIKDTSILTVMNKEKQRQLNSLYSEYQTCLQNPKLNTFKMIQTYGENVERIHTFYNELNLDTYKQTLIQSLMRTDNFIFTENGL